MEHLQQVNDLNSFKQITEKVGPLKNKFCYLCQQYLNQRLPNMWPLVWQRGSQFSFSATWDVASVIFLYTWTFWKVAPLWTVTWRCPSVTDWNLTKIGLNSCCQQWSTTPLCGDIIKQVSGSLTAGHANRNSAGCGESRLAGYDHVHGVPCLVYRCWKLFR